MTISSRFLMSFALLAALMLGACSGGGGDAPPTFSLMFDAPGGTGLADGQVNGVRDQLADRLLGLYQANRSDEWRWYEPVLSYCNGVLPHAMLMCGQWIPNNTMTEVGLESLHWLNDLQRTDPPGMHFSPIGSNGF